MGGTTIYATMTAGGNSPEVVAENAALRTSVDSMETQMGQMRKQMTALSAQLAAGGQARPDTGPSIRREISQQQIDQMVADAITKQMAAVTVAPVGGVLTEEQQELVRQQTLDNALAKFLDSNLEYADLEKVWDELAEAGLIDEAISMLEDEAALYPENEDLQLQLGLAYLQPMSRGNVAGVEAGQWAMKADTTFDSILKSNPENWDARFTKAISYSFWPPMFGKQQSAIDHFEILVGQQANQNSDPKFAQTHLLLGNMYYQTGQTEKATAAWNQGLVQFPEDAALREQLGIE
jgi:tetratricopeptide (TPR) repeat protein